MYTSHVALGSSHVHISKTKNMRPQLLRRFSERYIIRAITEIVAGTLMFILELVALCLVARAPTLHEIRLYGSGIYMGIFCVATGSCALIAGRKCTRGWIKICMILCIITASLCLLSLILNSYEYSRELHGDDEDCASYYYTETECAKFDPNLFVYLRIKTAIIIGASVVMLFLTSVHAGICCQSVCECCLKNAYHTYHFDNMIPKVSVITTPMYVQDAELEKNKY